MEHIDPIDYGMTLVFALRYALNRDSAAPSFISQQIRDSWEYLPQGTQETIIRDVREYVERENRGWTDYRSSNYHVFDNLLEIITRR